MNATRAYRAAGYRGSDAVCAVEGSKLLRNPKIALAIAEAMEARLKRTKIDADWVAKRLQAEAEADLADLYDDNGNLLPVKQWPLIWRQGLVAGVETVREKGRDGDGDGVVDKVKLSDRIKRIELLGKHVDVQAFKDRVEVDVTDDAAKLLAEARKAAGR
ncbi:terminase small subunit [Sphingopyxis lindanitolerans]|nr:terminase small subunit [Sphingopyxis lindanitolerans]